MIGLTASPEEIKKTARAYRVYYMKTEEEGSDYLVDHSIVMYVLLDPSYSSTSMIAHVSFDCLASSISTTCINTGTPLIFLQSGRSLQD